MLLFIHYSVHVPLFVIQIILFDLAICIISYRYITGIAIISPFLTQQWLTRYNIQNIYTRECSIYTTFIYNVYSFNIHPFSFFGGLERVRVEFCVQNFCVSQLSSYTLNQRNFPPAEPGVAALDNTHSIGFCHSTAAPSIVLANNTCPA